MSTTTSPDVNKLDLFVNSAVNTYKVAFDNSDWEKMEQLLSTQHNSHKSQKSSTFPLTTVIAALLAIAVLGVIIYQLSRKGLSPDIETTTPVEVKPEPIVKPPVKSKLDEIVPEKEDSTPDSEQLLNKDSGTVDKTPISVIDSKTATDDHVTTKQNTNQNTNDGISKVNTSHPDGVGNSGNVENLNNTGSVKNRGNNNGSNTDNTIANPKNISINTNAVSAVNNNSVNGYKKPPSALTILYNARKREKLKHDSIQRTLVPTKTIGSDIKEPELQIRKVEEPKLKGLNNLYKKNKSDSTQ